MTLKDCLDKIHDAGRITQEATREEMADILTIISEDMMAGRTTMLHSATIGDLAYALESPAARSAEYAQAERELDEAARAIGRKGGAAKTEAKVEASRANGAKGGRPKKISP